MIGQENSRQELHIHAEEAEGPVIQPQGPVIQHFGDRITVVGAEEHRFDWDSLLTACRAQVETTITRVGKKYLPALYVNRALEADFERFVTADAPDGRHCFLIIDRAGSGKTNLLCSLARRYARHQPTIFLLGMEHLVVQDDLARRIATALEWQNIRYATFQRCLNHLHELADAHDSDVLIFLDAINENSNIELMKQAIEELLTYTYGKRFKLCLTCRDIYWDFFRADFWDSFVARRVEGALYNYRQTEYNQALPRYFEAYGIQGKLVGDAAEKCKHPLLLRFFCEAYQGCDVETVEDIRLGELFDRYWERKIANIAQRMEEEYRPERRIERYLLAIAQRMLETGQRAIPVTELGTVTGERNVYARDSVYLRILDEDIVLEEELSRQGDERRVVFVYEEFMEYTMARGLMAKLSDCSEEEIIAEINRLAGDADAFANILGVMVYLSIALKKERGISLWHLLTSHGPRWQEVVCEAIRKLPEEHLDLEVFGVLQEMLLSEDKELQRRVADIFKLKRVSSRVPDESIWILAEKTQDKDLKLRRRAVVALTRVADTRVFPYLLAALEDEAGGVRKVAAQALGVLGQQMSTKQVHEALNKLIFTLGDPQKAVRQASAAAMKRIGRERDLQRLFQAYGLIDRTLGALEDSNLEKARRAARALGEVGDDQAMQALMRVFSEDPRHSLRCVIAEAFGRAGYADALGLLLLAALSHTEDHWVRTDAVRALGMIGQPAAIDGLMVLLQDERDDVRWNAATALGEIGDPSAAFALTAALSDREWSVREAAVRALGMLGDPAVCKSLVALADDDDYRVRIAVMDVLGQLRCTEMIDRLIQAFEDDKREVRVAAAKALGRIGGADVVNGVMQVAKSPKWTVRTVAAQALGGVGLESATKALWRMLNDGSKNVRRAALKALGQQGTAEAEWWLILALGHRREDVRDGARDTLLRLKKTTSYRRMLQMTGAAKKLAHASQDEDFKIRQCAIQAAQYLLDSRLLDESSEAILLSVLSRQRIKKHRAIKPGDATGHLQCSG